MFNHAMLVSSILKLHPSADTLEALDTIVSKGLPAESADSFASTIYPNHEEARVFKTKIAPALNNKQRVVVLDNSTSERLERLARTYALAVHVWGCDEEARTFFIKKHPMLNGQTPLDTSITELGAIRVSQLLYQLYFGVLSHIPK